MQRKINPKIFCLMAAFLTVLSFSSANQVITNEVALASDQTQDFYSINVVKFGLNYKNAFGVNASILLFLVTYFYCQVNKRNNDVDKRLRRITFCRSIAFCFFYGIWKKFSIFE